MKCPKCDGEMEEGRRKSGLYSSMQWVRKGKMTIFGAPSYKSYSCLSCGYIEDYVQRERIK